jgi:uncharacterized membrane protein YedE/YeeE
MILRSAPTLTEPVAAPPAPPPAASGRVARFARVALAVAVALGVIYAAHRAGASRAWGGAGGLAVLGGAVFGYLLQRSRFCFFCVVRDLAEERDGRGVLGIVVALAVGMLGYAVVCGAWVYDPTAGHLPPGAHIGPVSWALVLGGLVFGWGMALSGSCLSAHLYRLAEGSLLAPLALAGAVGGFWLGFLAWNPLYLSAIATAPVPWLPVHLGYLGSVGVQSVALGGLAWWLWRWRRPPVEPIPLRTGRDLAEAVFVRRWPAWVGGLGVGALAVAMYFRVAPLGVTAELGRWSRRWADGWGWLPSRLEGLDGFSGCSTAPAEGWVSLNGLFVLALIAGAFVSSLPAGQFRPARKPLRACVGAIAGGVLLGFGAMIALGCTIGTLLSGIMAFALSGWVFAVAMVTGVLTGLPLKRRFLE